MQDLGDSQIFNLEKGNIPGNFLVQIPAFIDVPAGSFKVLSLLLKSNSDRKLTRKERKKVICFLVIQGWCFLAYCICACSVYIKLCTYF